jgi:hypothetical protein
MVDMPTTKVKLQVRYRCVKRTLFERVDEKNVAPQLKCYLKIQIRRPNLKIVGASTIEVTLEVSTESEPGSSICNSVTRTIKGKLELVRPRSSLFFSDIHFSKISTRRQ